jgi:hypothetical protein
MREAGVFKKFGNPKINCNEFTLFDLLKLNIYEKNYQRPN